MRPQVLQLHRLMLVPERQQLCDGMPAVRIALRGERIFGQFREGAFHEERIVLRDGFPRGGEADSEFRKAPQLRQRDEILDSYYHLSERLFRAVSASRRDDRGFLAFLGAGIRLMIQDGGRRGNGARRDGRNRPPARYGGDDVRRINLISNCVYFCIFPAGDRRSDFWSYRTTPAALFVARRGAPKAPPAPLWRIQLLVPVHGIGRRAC